jgi:hypothetical protein
LYVYVIAGRDLSTTVQVGMLMEREDTEIARSSLTERRTGPDASLAHGPQSV